jgi:nitrate/TMAO reductase-like tetraheme cytochrome c subunit
MAIEEKAGIWRRLTRPSMHWSVLTLLIIGVVVGFVATAGTAVMVEVTGTDKFCGTACHSMTWVDQEHKASVHVANHTAVQAGCHDCHIPKHYPELLFVKAKKGIKDVIGEVRGVIDTEEKFKKERLGMAKVVWEEYKADNSQNCRNCHQFTPEAIKKQKEFAQPMHQQVLEGKATCIDCHKGVGHVAPTE